MPSAREYDQPYSRPSRMTVRSKISLGLYVRSRRIILDVPYGGPQ